MNPGRRMLFQVVRDPSVDGLPGAALAGATLAGDDVVVVAAVLGARVPVRASRRAYTSCYTGRKRRISRGLPVSGDCVPNCLIVAWTSCRCARAGVRGA